MAEHKKNLVSIGIPTYNREKVIGRTIESILAQSYHDFELIISDDASSDNTRLVCEQYAAKDNRIRYFRHQQNIGIKRNFEFVFKESKGEFFMFFGDDDRCSDKFVETLINALKNNPDSGVVMSSLERVYDDGEVKDTFIFAGKNDINHFTSNDVFKAAVFWKPPVHFFWLGLWRYNVLQKIYDRALPDVMGLDVIMIYEAALVTKFCSVPEIMYWKTIYRTPKVARYNDKSKKHYEDRRVEIRSTIAAFNILLTSNNFSLRQKIFVLPSKLSMIFWLKKRQILREIYYVLWN